MLHEATLIHDDVVDEAPTRRGLLSIPARYHNKIAVLFGDYMLSTVLIETLSVQDKRWTDILAETARRMSRGELLAAARARRMEMTESDYFQMIGDKTAALFSACCRLGGLTGGLDDDAVHYLGKYGESIGLAFQIQDDMLDLFGDGHGLGKPMGGDLKERKLTLPLLWALSQVDKRTGRRIKARIRRGVKRGEIKLIADFIRQHGGDNYALEVMNIQRDRAVESLNHLPPSEIRDGLVELADSAVNRRR